MSCSSTQNITGSYRSNFAELGFFSTRIKLKPDNTFEYRFRGDLIFDTATGKYRIDRRKLILTYDPRPIDTSGLSYMRSVGFKLDEPLNLKSDAGLPHVFYIGREKLYGSYQDGKIVRKAVGYSKRKQYLFFGTHYYKRKHYLKRVD
ncbi:MAG: hypothetical protein H7329_20990 [Opitutaceae bacterium]|nr:hypothetical protein [Cytophagales bacterium]